MFRAATVSQPVASPRRRTNRPRRGDMLARLLLILAAAILDGLAILALAAVTGLLPPETSDASRADILSAFLCLGGLVALLFIITTLLRREYGIARRRALQGLFRRTSRVWAIAVGAAFATAFVMHIGSELAPDGLLGFFLAGFVTTYVTRLCFFKATETHTGHNGIVERRIFLIGDEADVQIFSQRYENQLAGTHIIAATVLRTREYLEEDLALACASARILLPDDVFILVPWAEAETIEACVDAFRRLPAAIHLGAEAAFDRFADAEIAQVGPIASLNLVRRPLSPVATATKRLMDVVLAGLGLVLLAPLFLVIAAAIKLDSSGPVIFRQRRYGFNQQHFRIFKFRSMRTMEDSSTLTQVVEGDSRVTRMGKFMRRHNIDELPQLINVLLGDMSLVGPRPHALAHDQAFERTIALYARRHTVKPGITGWAQVNGLRGGFSRDQMYRRIQHDLYYIDNWSLWLDIKILWLTLASKKSYQNAY